MGNSMEKTKKHYQPKQLPVAKSRVPTVLKQVETERLLMERAQGHMDRRGNKLKEVFEWALQEYINLCELESIEKKK